MPRTTTGTEAAGERAGAVPGAAPPASARGEQGATARAGAVLFRNRSWLPVPFVVVALLAPGHSGMSNWVIGAVLVAVGEWIRLAGVAAAGSVTRRRSREVERLVTYGIFRWVRNPLYVGNFFAWMGFVVISGVLWFLPVAVLLFALEYSLIVAYEEAVLETIFGAPYVAYKQVTPRWIPRRPRPAGESGPLDWGEAWKSETSTFLQYVALVIVFVLKERWMGAG